MRIGTPASRWPLRLRRLACRAFGHKPVKIVKHGRLSVQIGVGCARCERGHVKSYPTKGPLPLAVKQAIPHGKD